MAAKKKNKKKTSTKKPATRKKAAAKTRNIGPRKKKKTRKAVRTQGKRAQKRKQSVAPPARPRRIAEEPELSGDLQGVSRVESADSESVDELLEEGNAFEAGVVEGVEDADAHAERGVHTREVPEDDVPEEYLDQD